MTETGGTFSNSTPHRQSSRLSRLGCKSKWNDVCAQNVVDRQGKHDEVPEDNFYLKGNIDEIAQ
jgi:hypothetical protein